MSRETVPRSRKLLNKGQIISMGIAVYMVLKPVFNFILLGGALAPIAIGIAAASQLRKRFWTRRSVMASFAQTAPTPRHPCALYWSRTSPNCVVGLS